MKRIVLLLALLIAAPAWAGWDKLTDKPEDPDDEYVSMTVLEKDVMKLKAGYIVPYEAKQRRKVEALEEKVSRLFQHVREDGEEIIHLKKKQIVLQDRVTKLELCLNRMGYHPDKMKTDTKKEGE